MTEVISSSRRTQGSNNSSLKDPEIAAHLIFNGGDVNDDDSSICSTISLPRYGRATTSPDNKKQTVYQITSHDMVQLGHYLNSVGAATLAFYFTYYNSYRCLQYYQISFVSILILLSERKHSPFWNKIFLLCGLIIGIFWNVVITILFYNDLSTTSSASSSPTLVTKVLSVITTTSSFTLILSWLYYAYFSKPVSIDMDLMLYFLAMNIIAFFSADEFNNTLHFLIDIRTYQFIFTAALSLKSKFDLVLSPQFLIILLLMLIAYVFLSLGVNWGNFVGFALYSLIGLIMFTVPIIK